MDGARFANALVALGVLAGRDDLAGRRRRALVRRDQERRARLRGGGVLRQGRARRLSLLRKRGGHTLSKGRLLGAQMAAYLEDGLWLDSPRAPTPRARRLSEGLVALPGVRWPGRPQANEVFVVAPTSGSRPGARRARFSTMADPRRSRRSGRRAGETLVRLVTSFETSDAEIDSFLALARAR